MGDSFLLRVSGVEKSFGAVRALRGISFELRAGEVHALVGENGAGKSTFVRAVTGAIALDAGTIETAGEARVAAIYQQPALFPDLSVAENIAIAVESGGRWRRIDWPRRVSRANTLLDRVGGGIDVRMPARSLSFPQQQLVEIAKALGSNARVFIMDEPTAALSEQESSRLFEIVRGLRKEGKGVIYITHRLDELFEIADRVTVLRDGEAVGTRAMAGIDRTTMIQMMVGRDVTAVFPKREVTAGEGAFRVNLPGCDFEIHKGEVFGLGGLIGAGRTELAETLFGLRRGGPYASPEEAIANGVAYVPEDRRQHGVIAPMSIAQNMSLAALKGFSLDTTGEAAQAESYRERLQVKATGIHAPVATLSGGNQQKVALARWLATKPKLLILDEPTQGVDVGAKAEIHRIIGELAGQGMAILMISSELPELIGMSDRIGILVRGKLAGIVPRAEATEERLAHLAFGAEAA